MRAAQRLLAANEAQPATNVADALTSPFLRQQVALALAFDGSIVGASEHFLRTFGYSEVSLLGRHIQTLFDRETRPLAEVTAHGTPRLEDCRTSGGSKLRMLLSYTHLDAGIIAQFVDATPALDHSNLVTQAFGDRTTALMQAVTTLQQLSNDIGHSASQTSAQSYFSSAVSAQVTESVQTAAANTAEMAQSIASIAANASTAAQVAASGVTVAQDTNAIVAKLGESSQEIGKVANIISTIARQSNFLALNATIEAARAGEAGRGFAVVANEVKELAKETARATEDIGRTIDTIQSDARAAVQAIAEITRIISEISTLQANIASAVEHQNRATTQISRNVEDAAKGSREIADNITAMTEFAEQSAAGAANTAQATANIVQILTGLETVVNQARTHRAKAM